jgi:hypothetical protein
MLKKFRWPAILALGATMTFLTPGTVQARDRDDYEREHYRHRHHHRVVVSVHHRQSGYYDRHGYWHPYGYYDREGYWHAYR